MKLQSNSVITNSSGAAKFVRYNRVDLCSKCSFGTDKFVPYTWVFIITEIVITEFRCITIWEFKIFFFLGWSSHSLDCNEARLCDDRFRQILWLYTLIVPLAPWSQPPGPWGPLKLEPNVCITHFKYSSICFNSNQI